MLLNLCNPYRFNDSPYTNSPEITPFSSFPSPRLGTHLPGEAPQLPVTGDPKLGLRAQMRSQAGAWEREKPRLRGNAGLRRTHVNFLFFPTAGYIFSAPP